MWAVKILLTLRKAAEAGVPSMKSPELLAACVAPHADTYMYRRALRELVAKTDFVTCDIQSSRTTYEWNPDVRPSLYDLVIRLEGGIHETSNAFWSYENTYTMQPLHKVNKRYDALTREYLSSIYVDELDSPALSERSRAKLPHMKFTNDRTCGTTHLINNPKNETSLHYCIVRFRERICFCPGKREPGCAEPHRTGAL